MKDEGGRLVYGTGIDNDQLVRDAQQSMKILRGIGSTAETEGKKMDMMSASITKGLAAIGGTTAVTMIGKEIVDTTAKFEKFDIVLKNTLGDARGAQALDMITRFAATTPFQLDEVTASFIKMANQGFVPTWEQLTKLGDLASSTGKTFDQLTEALLDAQTGQFERLKEFGIKASQTQDKVTFSFKEQETTVDKTNSAIQNYLLSLGELQGVSGANAKISEGLAGQLSNLEDKFASMYNSIGKDNKGLIYEAVGGVSDLVGNYEEVGRVIIELIAVYGTYKAALIALNAIHSIQEAMAVQRALAINAETGARISLTTAEAFGAVVETKLTATQLALNKSILANPYVLAAVGITALAYGVYKLLTYQTQAEKAQNRLNETIRQSENEMASETVQIDTMFARLKAAKKGTEEYDAAKKAIMSKYGEYLSKLGDEKTALDNIALAYKTIIENAREAANARAMSTATTDAADSLVKEQADLKDRLKEELDKKYGKDSKQSLTFYYQIAPLIDEGKGSSAFKKGFLDLFDETHTLNGITETSNKLREIIGLGVYAKKVYDESVDKAKMRFGSNDKSTTTGDGPKEGERKKIDGVWNTYKNGQWVPDKILVKPEKLTANETNKMKLEEKRYNEDLENQATQSTIDLMKSGAEKVRAQMDLDHQLKILTLKHQEEDLLQKIRENAEKEWKSKGNKGTFDPNTLQLPEETKTIFSGLRSNEDTAFLNSKKALYQDMLDEHQKYSEKVQQINLKYNQLEQQVIENNPEDVERLKILEGERKKELEEITKAILNENGLLDLYAGDGSDYIEAKIKAILPMFEDVSKLTFSELQKVRDLIGTIELSPELLESLKIAGVDVEKLKKALENAKKSAGDSTNERVWEKVIDSSNKLSSSLKNLGSVLSDTEGILGDVGNGILALSTTLDGLSSLKSATKGTEKDKMAVVSTGIEGLVEIYSMIASQIEKNKEAQDEWNQSITESAHQMALTRIEAAGKNDQNIFSTTDNPYKSAIASAMEYKQAMIELNNSQALLNAGQVQIGTTDKISGSNIMTGAGAGAATGAAVGTIFAGFTFGLSTLIGAGIGAIVGGIAGAITKETVPVFNSLKDTYGTIVMDDYSLNPQILADYDKLDDATKKLVDNWGEIKDKAEEARASVEETFKNLVGDLGSTLSDQLVDAFRNGDLFDAVDDFHDYMTGVIEDIIAKMIFSKTIQPFLDQLASDMDQSFGIGANVDKSKIDYDITDDMVKFGENYQKGLEMYNLYMSQASTSLKDYTLYEKKSSKNSGSSSGYATASQDSIDELSGRSTAIHISTLNIEKRLGELVECSFRMDGNLFTVTIKLTEMRDIALDSYFQLSDINKNTKQLFEMNDKLSKIEKNTQNL